MGINIWEGKKADSLLSKMNDLVNGMENLVNVMSAKKPIVYAFHIDGAETNPSDAVTYLEDAVGMIPARMSFSADDFSYGSWGNAFFMPRPCMLKFDGTVDYYLDPDDYSKKIDGTASDVANTAYQGNAMMEWGRNGKKIWYKIVPDDGDTTSATVYISDAQVDENYRAWSFVNANGELGDHFYTAIYYGTIVNDGTKDVLRSISGVSGNNRCKGYTQSQEQTLCRANNQTATVMWDTAVYADYTLINLLLILIGKSLDTQAVFGKGICDAVSGATTSERCDAIPTGAQDAKGMFYGTSSGNNDTAGNTVKVFGMENWWGYAWRRLTGAQNVNRNIKYKMTKGTADGSAADDYVISDTDTDFDGYLLSGTASNASSASNYNEAIFNVDQFSIKTASGSDWGTHYCDGATITNKVAPLLAGGGANDALKCGAFTCQYVSGAIVTGNIIGTTLSCKPV